MKKKDYDYDEINLKTLLGKSKKDKKFVAVKREIAENHSKKLIDDDTTKTNKSWSELANQIVGSESL